MSKIKTFYSKIFILLGVCLVVAGAYVLAQNLAQEIHASHFSDDILVKIQASQNTDSTQTNANEIYIDGNSYIGILEIPTLDLEFPIQSDWSYDKLKNTPCVYSEEPFVIAAHNYSVHFGKLKNLQTGDQVIFTDVNNNEVYYQVELIEYIYETQIDELLADGRWDLTLFTCNVNNNVERVVVRLMQVS